MAELSSRQRYSSRLSSLLLPVSDYELRDGKPIVQTCDGPPDQIIALEQLDERLTPRRTITHTSTTFQQWSMPKVF
mgnify:CR=1 FL=1